MKKLVCVMCLICLALPVFADNLLQQKYEDDFNKDKIKTHISTFILFDGIDLLKDDYDGYNNGRDTMYGEIMYLIEDINKKNAPYKNLNIEYLNKIKSNIVNAANNDINPSPIIVDDEEYKHLTEDTKILINLNNINSTTDKTTYINDVIEGYNYQINQWNEDCKKYKYNSKKLKEIYDDINKEKELTKKYLEKYRYTSDRSEIIYNKVKEMNSSLSNLSSQIYKLGEAYEKQKFIDWAKRNNKNINCGSLSNFVYAPYAPPPQIGCVYTYLPQRDFTLQVLQSVNGGVILTGSYSLTHATHINNIFLQTVKTFADGQYIMEPLVVEYKGYYDYYTVLGAKKRIHKFYRYGQKEINANFNIPGQPFYFYQAY